MHPVAIEALRVYAVELGHPIGKIRLGRLDQHMVVVAHQAIGMTAPIKAADHLSQHTRKTSSGRYHPNRCPPWRCLERSHDKLRRKIQCGEV